MIITVFKVIGITISRFVKACAYFFVALGHAIISVVTVGIVSLVTNVTSLTFLGVMLFVVGIGLINVNNANFMLKTADMFWECGIFKVCDGTTTYALRPAKDYVVMPVIDYVNDISEYIKGKSDVMVDRIVAASNGTVDREDVAECIDAVWDWLIIDWLESPYKATPPLWGPDKLVLPFEVTLIKATTMVFTDDILVNRYVFNAIEKLLLSFLKGDTLTRSCYYQYLPNAKQDAWAFRGCAMFDDESCPWENHLNGTCTDAGYWEHDCFDFTDEVAYYMAPYVLEWMTGVFTNVTAEMESLAHSLKETDVCSALVTGTCDTTADGCTCREHDCTVLPWWVSPKTFDSLHCLAKNATRTFEELGTTCALVDLCRNATNRNATAPKQCAYVDGSMAFKGMTCAEVKGASLLGRKSCVDMDDGECFHKDWSYWIDYIVRLIAVLPNSAAHHVTDFTQRNGKYIKSILGLLLYAFDKSCQATPIEKVQYLVYYVFWSWTGCTIPIAKFLSFWKLEPIGIGYEQLWQVVGQMIASVIDGSVITKSAYYCEQMRGPVTGCGAFARAFMHGCEDIAAGAIFTGSQAGLLLRNVTCASAGFTTRCPEPLGCSNMTNLLCSYFEGKTCIEVGHFGEIDVHDFDSCRNNTNATGKFCNYIRDGVILIPGQTCASMRNGCALRQVDSYGGCALYAGCRVWKSAFDESGGCGDGLHHYTHDILMILSNTTANLTTNFMSLEFNEWSVSAKESTKEFVRVKINKIFSAFDCVVNLLKALFGFLNLLFDTHCETTFKENLDFIVDRVIADSIECLHLVGDVFGELKWMDLQNFWNRMVDILSDLVPHFWHLSFLHSDSWYCSQAIEFTILYGANPLVQWDDGRWAFEGCDLFDEGDCAIAQAMCTVEETPAYECVCEACNDPVADIFWLWTDFFEWLIGQVFGLFGLSTILNDLVSMLGTQLRLFVDALVSATYGFAKNFIGFFMLFSLKGCHRPGWGIAIYFLQSVLLHIPLVMLNYVVAMLTAYGEFIWELLKILLRWLVDETKVFKFIFDALEDASTIGYCFKGNMTGEDGIFTFRQRPAGMNQLYDFPACMKAWPKDKCDLSACFEMAWTCVKYSNVTQGVNTPREYNWLGKAVANMEGLVHALMSTTDAIVCPWPCIKDCKYCKGLQRLKCFFKCFKNPEYSCVHHNEENEQQNVIYDLYDWGCDTKCSCDDYGQDFGCQLPCWTMKGNETNQQRFPCMSLSNASDMCHSHINQAMPAVYLNYNDSGAMNDYVKHYLTYDPMSYETFWPLPNSSDTKWIEHLHSGTDKDPAPLCTQFSNIYEYSDVIEKMKCDDLKNCSVESNVTASDNSTESCVDASDWYPNTCTEGQQRVYDKFREAREFCETTCTFQTATPFWTSLQRVRAGCMAQYMMMSSPLNLAEAHRVMMSTLPGMAIDRNNDDIIDTIIPSVLDRFYHEWAMGDRAWWAPMVQQRHRWQNPPAAVFYNGTTRAFAYCQAMPWSAHFYEVLPPYIDRVWESVACGVVDCTCCHYMKRLAALVFAHAINADPVGPSTFYKWSPFGGTQACSVTATTSTWNAMCTMAKDNLFNWRNMITTGYEMTVKVEEISWYDKCDIILDDMPTNCTSVRTVYYKHYSSTWCPRVGDRDFKCWNTAMPPPPSQGGHLNISDSTHFCNGTETEDGFSCNYFYVDEVKMFDMTNVEVICNTYDSVWIYNGVGINNKNDALVTTVNGVNYTFDRANYELRTRNMSSCYYPATGAPASCYLTSVSRYRVCPCAFATCADGTCTYISPPGIAARANVTNCTDYTGPHLDQNFTIPVAWGVSVKGEFVFAWGHFSNGTWIQDTDWPRSIHEDELEYGTWFTKEDTANSVLIDDNWYPYNRTTATANVSGFAVPVPSTRVCPSRLLTWYDLPSDLDVAAKEACEMASLSHDGYFMIKQCPAVETRVPQSDHCKARYRRYWLYACAGRHCITEKIVPLAPEKPRQMNQPTRCGNDGEAEGIFSEYTGPVFMRAEDKTTAPPETQASVLESFIVQSASQERRRLRDLKNRHSRIPAQPNMPSLGPCACETILSEKTERDDFVYRLGQTYCKAAKELYDKDPKALGAREAYCLVRNEALGTLKSVIAGTRAIVEDINGPDSVFYYASKNLAAREMLHFAEQDAPEGSGDTYADRLKNVVSDTITTLQNSYQDSVLERVIDSGWDIYEREKATGESDVEAEENWALDSMYGVYEWATTEREQQLLRTRTMPISKHRHPPGHFVRGIGYVNNVENILTLAKRVLEPAGRLKASQSKFVLPAAAAIADAVTVSSPIAKAWNGTTSAIDAIFAFNLTAVLDDADSPVVDGAKRILQEAEHRMPWHWNTTDVVPWGWVFAKAKKPGDVKVHKRYLFFSGSEKLLRSWREGLSEFGGLVAQHYKESEEDRVRIRATSTPSPSQSTWDVPLVSLADRFQDSFDYVIDKTDKSQFKETIAKLGDRIVDLVECHSPEQYDGTDVYNVACIALPAILIWIPSNPVSPAQIRMPDELIKVACTKTDYPPGQRHYFDTYRKNCPADGSKDTAHPLCPTCDYCEREYDAYAVRMDMLDCALLSINYVARVFHATFDPEFSGGYHATWIDNIHFLINVILLFVITMTVVGFFLGSMVGVNAGWVVAFLYMFYCGFWVHVVVLGMMWILWGQFIAAAGFAIFAVLLLVGGVSFYIDPIGWIAVALRAMADTFFIQELPGIVSGAQRFERFAFGDGPIPDLYNVLAIINISKIAADVIIVYVVVVVFGEPMFIVFSGWFDAWMIWLTAILDIFVLVKLDRLQEKARLAQEHIVKTDVDMQTLSNQLRDFLDNPRKYVELRTDRRPPFTPAQQVVSKEKYT